MGDDGALRDAEVVIEAGPEAEKADALAALEVHGPKAIIVETRANFVRDLAEALRRPERVVGLRRHGRLAELVRTPFADDSVLALAKSVLESRGITCIEVPDAAGGVVDRLVQARWAEAQRAAKAEGDGLPDEVDDFLRTHAGPVYQPKGTSTDIDAITWGVACHIAADGVRPRDVDRLASTVGLAPFAQMNRVGLTECLEQVARVHNHWLDDFPLPANLQAQAESGRPWNLPVVRHSHRDGVSTITLDRPESFNAISPEILTGLDEALDQAAASGARVIVLEGRGAAFSAGADIRAMAKMERDAMQAFAQHGLRVFKRISCGPPCIAAVHGQVLGGGLELALSADLILAADDALLGLPEVKVGLHPGWGGITRVRERIGVGGVNRLVLTAKPVDAARAHALGLVDGVTTRDDLPAMVQDIAKEMASHAPVAMQAAKSLLFDGVDAESDSVLALWDTHDRREGFAAFQERRVPRFTGR